MNSLLDVLNKKVEEVSKSNLDRGQKRKKINAFVKNVFAVIELINDREKKRPDINYHYISQEKFKDVIKRDVLRAEVMKFLKQNNIIEVLKRDEKEFYIHFEHDELGLKKQPKGYRITEYGHKLLKEAINDQQFKKLIRDYKVTRKEVVKYTPEDVMKKYSKEEYYLKTRTRESIEKVLKNNLELEFHPLRDEEMIKLFKEQKPEANDEDIKIQLELVKDYFANKEFTYNVRLYSAFTSTPKCWRRFVTNKDRQRVIELFDIRSSIMNILPLVCRMVLRKQNVSADKFNKFLKEQEYLESILNDKNQDIYKIIGNGMDRQKIKDNLMLVMFRTNEIVKKIEKTPKGKIVNNAKNKIKLWLQQNTPIMYEVLSNFEQIKEGKETKSMFWYYFQKFETELMVNLNSIFASKLGTKIYNIHDGCFVKESIIPKNEYERNELQKKILSYYIEIKKVLKNQISNGKIDKDYKEQNTRIYKDFKEATKANITDWLKTVGTKQDLKDVEDERYFDLYKIAYEYKAGKIKSTRDM